MQIMENRKLIRMRSPTSNDNKVIIVSLSPEVPNIVLIIDFDF